MQPRHGLVDIFSTFLQFEGDRVGAWSQDPKLRRNMQRCLDQTPHEELSEIFWALYWHKAWQDSPDHLRPEFAQAHLCAYLQEVCYWAAQKTASRFTNSRYSLTDYFQIAITQLQKVLMGFNPDQGFNLKNYASATFSSLMRESLRQRREIDICTDWALLRKLSQKRLVEALGNNGLPPQTIDSYVLAWTCFKTVYVPQQATGTQKLQKPEPAIWGAIAQLYNSERTSQLSCPGSATSPEQLEKTLTLCAQAARAYLYPTLMSINTLKPGQDSGEFLEDLSDTAGVSLLSTLIAEEEAQTRQTQQTQISQILTDALQQLDPQSQLLLQLYYCQQFTQQKIAERLAIKQYTISRCLTKVRGSLLQTLAQWSQDTLHITPSADVLKTISTTLEEWLINYYRDLNSSSLASSALE
jgi:RNA polymerase sigma factor (sigma-70 family)